MNRESTQLLGVHPLDDNAGSPGTSMKSGCGRQSKDSAVGPSPALPPDLSPVRDRGGRPFSGTGDESRRTGLPGTNRSLASPRNALRYRLPEPTAGGKAGMPAPKSEWFCAFLLRQKRGVMLLLVVLAAVSAGFAPKLVGETTLRTPQVSGSPPMAVRAAERLHAAFPDTRGGEALVTLQTTDDTDIFVSAGQQGEAFQQQLKEQAIAAVSRIEGYYLVEGDDKQRFVPSMTVRNDTTYLRVVVGGDGTGANEREITDWLLDYVSKYGVPPHMPENIRVNVLSPSVFIANAHRTANAEIRSLLAASLPMAIVVFAFCLRSLRLVIIPALVLFITFPISFACAYGIAKSTSTLSVTPVFMLAINIATSVSYTLVMLARYREALLERQGRGIGFNGGVAVIIMMATAARTVIIAGLTLCVCLLGVAFFRIGALRTIGLCCGLVVAVSTAGCLVVAPLALLVRQGFWVQCAKENGCWAQWDRMWDGCMLRCSSLFCRTRTRRGDTEPQPAKPSSYGAADDGYDSDWNDPRRGEVVPYPAGTRADAARLVYDSDGIDRSSGWYYIGKVTTKAPWNLVILCAFVGVTVPVDARATGFEMTAGILPRLPRSGEVTVRVRDVGDEFGYGIVWPTQILLQLKEDVLTPTGWVAAQDALKRLNDEVPSFELRQADTAVLLLGKDVPFGGAANASVEEFVNGANIWVRYLTTFEPMSAEGREWLSGVRSAAERVCSSNGIEVFFAGVPPEEIDAMNNVLDDYTAVLGVTGAVVIGVAALAFRSVFIPLRAVAARAVTIAFVYGLADLVYTEGALDWADVSSINSDINNEIVYTNPLAALPILIGIGLGVDFILLDRVMELRRLMQCTAGDGDEPVEEAEDSSAGVCGQCATKVVAALTSSKPTRRAVVIGLCRTGAIISSSGLALFVAFAGMLFSDVPLLNQLSFYLLAAVLFDTFAARPFLVPTSISVAGEASWWPAALHGFPAGGGPGDEDGKL